MLDVVSSTASTLDVVSSTASTLDVVSSNSAAIDIAGETSSAITFAGMDYFRDVVNIVKTCFDDKAAEEFILSYGMGYEFRGLVTCSNRLAGFKSVIRGRRFASSLGSQSSMVLIIWVRHLN